MVYGSTSIRSSARFIVSQSCQDVPGDLLGLLRQTEKKFSMSPLVFVKLRALRAHVPYIPTCLKVLRT